AWFEGACATRDARAIVRDIPDRPPGDEVPGEFTPVFARATLHMWLDEHDAAAAGFADVLEHDRRRGDVWGQAHARLKLAQVAWRAGRWDAADSYTRECAALTPPGDPHGGAANRFSEALLALHRGDPDAGGAAARALQGAAGDRLWAARSGWLLAVTELAAGR